MQFSIRTDQRTDFTYINCITRTIYERKRMNTKIITLKGKNQPSTIVSGHNHGQYDRFFIGNMNSLVTVHYLPIDGDFLRVRSLSRIIALLGQMCPNKIYWSTTKRYRCTCEIQKIYIHTYVCILIIAVLTIVRLKIKV